MFLLAFLLYPFVEIFVFILVARATSWETAFLLTIATTALGIIVLRLQRRGPIFGSSGLSENSLKNYLFGNLGAFALILPGFVTDLLGLLIAIPLTRNLLLGFFKLCRIDLYKTAGGSFSVFKTWSFDSNSHKTSYRRNGTPSDPIIDVDVQNTYEPLSSNLDEEPIDVDFTTRD
ncbi:MAG: FxsA family protein [Thermoguttaceae bacterium]|jgi:UPF0716 family protein affecting phage T7 exclusion